MSAGSGEKEFSICCQGEMGRCEKVLSLQELQEHLSSSAFKEILEAFFASYIRRHSPLLPNTRLRLHISYQCHRQHAHLHKMLRSHALNTKISIWVGMMHSRSTRRKRVSKTVLNARHQWRRRKVVIT